MTRRKFLKIAAGVASVPLLTTTWGVVEACSFHVTEHTIAVPRLPKAFAGKTIALLTDIHHGPQNSLSFVRSIVETTNALQPDLIALSGDFVQKGVDQLRPCFEVLSALRAPLGVFAVPGNHDMTEGGAPARRTMTEFGIADLTNRGRWVETGDGRIRLSGVDDLWWGKPDPVKALAGVSEEETVILLAHNPDFVETLTDSRIGLVLSGHMHGGQIYLPGIGAPWLPSKYGQKYIHGLVQGPVAQVFVSGGLGTVGLPMRINSRPEINLLTLVPKEIEKNSRTVRTS